MCAERAPFAAGNGANASNTPAGEFGSRDSAPPLPAHPILCHPPWPDMSFACETTRWSSSQDILNKAKPRTDEQYAARVMQSAFRGRMGRRHVSLRRVAALMSGKTYADSDEEAEVEGEVAQHLRRVLRKNKSRKGSLVAGYELDAVPEVSVAPASNSRNSSPGRVEPPRFAKRALRVVPLSAPPTAAEADARRVIDAAFLTWNVNGHAISPEDARAWAAAAGPADAYFISIQELIDIEAKEGLPDREVRLANSKSAAAAAAAVMGEALSEACGETMVPVGEPVAMLAIFLCVFVRPELAAPAAPLFPAVGLPAHYTKEAADALDSAGHAEQAATMRAKVGQKGGVILGLRLGGSGAGDCGGGGGVNFCVLATHLPAGDKDSSTGERDLAAADLRRRMLERPPFLTVSRLASCISSGRSQAVWAARHSQGGR